MEVDRGPQRRPTEQYGSGPAETKWRRGNRTAMSPGCHRSVAAARRQPPRKVERASPGAPVKEKRKKDNNKKKSTTQLQAFL